MCVQEKKLTVMVVFEEQRPVAAVNLWRVGLWLDLEGFILGGLDLSIRGHGGRNFANCP